MNLIHVLIIATFAVFVMQVVFPPTTTMLALTPTAAFSGAVWQFVTYMFTHGGYWHIFLNMLFLFILGVDVERVLGSRRFLTLYIVSGIGSALLFIALSGIDGSLLLGASGAVSGVLVAFAFLFPQRRIIIIPILFPLRGPVLVAGLLVLETLLGLTNAQPGIANFGHVGGAVFGFFVVQYYLRIRRWRPRARELHGLDFAWE